MNAPNVISLARLAAVPLAVWLILRDRLDLAFWLFVAAGVSDAVDGYLARKLDSRTELGRYLDPLADKMLLVCVFLSLGYVGRIEMWVVILVVSRDVMIVGGVVLAAILGSPLPARPSLVSKINTAAQIVFAAIVLARHGLALEMLFPDGVLLAGSFVVGTTTLVSGAGYVATWIRHMSEANGDG